MRKNYKPGDIARKLTQHITGKPVLNTGQAKRVIADYFGARRILKTSNKNELMRHFRDKYKMKNTPAERAELIKMIFGGKTAEQIRKEKEIAEKRKKGNIGYARSKDESGNKYTHQHKVAAIGSSKSIDKEVAKKVARREDIQNKYSRGFASGLRGGRDKSEMSREEIKEETLKKVLSEGGEKVGYASLGIRDVEREKSQLSALQGKNSGSPTVFNPIGVTSAAKKGTVGVGGMNQSGNAKPINTNNKLGPGSGGSSLRGTPPPF